MSRITPFYGVFFKRILIKYIHISKLLKYYIIKKNGLIINVYIAHIPQIPAFIAEIFAKNNCATNQKWAWKRKESSTCSFVNSFLIGCAIFFCENFRDKGWNLKNMSNILYIIIFLKAFQFQFNSVVYS
jgi:hypothetical protein